MASPLTLCADDFGQSGAVNEAILELAGRQTDLNATTSWSTGPRRRQGSPALAAGGMRSRSVSTSSLSGERTPLESAWRRAGRLPHVDALTARAFRGPPSARSDLEAEIERQCERFVDLAAGRRTFVDGHQHVHVLPRIRGRFLRIARRRAPGAWIRTCEEKLAAIWRRRVYRWMAARSALAFARPLPPGGRRRPAHQSRICRTLRFPRRLRLWPPVRPLAGRAGARASRHMPSRQARSRGPPRRGASARICVLARGRSRGRPCSGRASPRAALAADWRALGREPEERHRRGRPEHDRAARHGPRTSRRRG